MIQLFKQDFDLNLQDTRTGETLIIHLIRNLDYDIIKRFYNIYILFC